MTRKLLVVLLAMILGFAFSGIATAGILGYNIREKELEFTKTPGPPSSAVVAADALIGRPLGLATTIAGTAVFLVTLPASAGSGSTDEAAWGLIGRPGGWTFKRPMGQGMPVYEETGIFR